MELCDFKWHLIGFLVSFVLFQSSNAAPVTTGHPCSNKEFFNKECHINAGTGLPTFDEFKELPVNTQVNIAGACATIKFFCSAETTGSIEGQSDVESKDVCNNLAVLNNQPIDCTKVEKVKECEAAKNFTQKLKDSTFCESICTIDKGQTDVVCLNLLRVQTIAVGSASSEKKQSTEDAPGGDAKDRDEKTATKVDEKAQLNEKPSSVKKEQAEMKASQSPSSTTVVEKSNATNKDNAEKLIESGPSSTTTGDGPEMNQDSINQTEDESKPNEKGQINTEGHLSSEEETAVKQIVQTTTQIIGASDESGEKNADAIAGKVEDEENVAGDVTNVKNEAEEKVDPNQNGKEQERLIEDKTEPPKSPDHINVDTSDVKAKPQIVNPLSKTINESEGYSQVMSYFFALTIICIVGYLIFHNKQKLIALILEGRRRPSGRRGARRSSSAQYRKLDNNLEEASGPNSSAATFSQAVY